VIGGLGLVEDLEHVLDRFVAAHDGELLDDFAFELLVRFLLREIDERARTLRV
jgi:hypothetical protein